MGTNKENWLEIRKNLFFPTLTPYYTEPLALVKASGSRVWDDSNVEYLDAIGGIVSISVGHNHPRIVKKIREMLDGNVIQHTTHLYLTGYMERLAQRLAEVAPGDLGKCFFTNSGSEANEISVMTARVATGEQTIVALRHAYHGGTGTTLGLCGHGTWKFRAQPPAAIVHAMEPYCYRCPFKATRGNCSFECATDVKNVIETVTNGKIAAFIAEPIQGVGGFIDPPVEYHKRVFDIVKSFGGKYISDEVQTGVGRAGKHFFAIEESGVVPDFISMAKGFGNGAPIGAVIAKKECADAMAGKLQFNTFGGDPFQAMQAGEVIDIIKEENLINNAKVQGDFLKEGLLALQKDFPIIGDVRGRGLLLGMELVKDPKTKEPASDENAKFLNLTRQNGLLIGKGGLKGNVTRITPPLNLTRSDSEEILSKLRKSFEML
ncbi:MAG: aspartate aminotransferase family protein [Deltaproteobacteria bacterium HGW-Deltaproteobacteria-22]|nr:MAG: aspartate aminotransferase family protein [Deltaproteobacteria bacterium HGW-Deltaproteobacteria-22]